MKKLASCILAVCMVLSISVSAFAAETKTNISVSDLISQKTETFTIDGKSITHAVYTVPIGATLSITGSHDGVNPGIENYISTGNNAYETGDGGLADFSISITSSMKGSFFKYFAENLDTNLETYAYIRVGNQQASNATKDPSASSTGLSTKGSGSGFKSDTGSHLSLVYGKTYVFKITSLNGKKPGFVCGNSSIFKVSYRGRKRSNYYFMVRAVGKAGQSAGIYINGSKTPSTVATVR